MRCALFNSYPGIRLREISKPKGLISMQLSGVEQDGALGVNTLMGVARACANRLLQGHCNRNDRYILKLYFSFTVFL